MTCWLPSCMRRTFARKLIVWFLKSKTCQSLKKANFSCLKNLFIYNRSLWWRAVEWKKRYLYYFSIVAYRRGVEWRGGHGENWYIKPRLVRLLTRNLILDCLSVCITLLVWVVLAALCVCIRVWKMRHMKSEPVSFIALTLTWVLIGESECWD